MTIYTVTAEVNGSNMQFSGTDSKSVLADAMAFVDYMLGEDKTMWHPASACILKFNNWTLAPRPEFQ